MHHAISKFTLISNVEQYLHNRDTQIKNIEYKIMGQKKILWNKEIDISKSWMQNLVLLMGQTL